MVLGIKNILIADETPDDWLCFVDQHHNRYDIHIYVLSLFTPPSDECCLVAHLLAEGGEAEEVAHHAQAGGEDGGHARHPEQQRLQHSTVCSVITRAVNERFHNIQRTFPVLDKSAFHTRIFADKIADFREISLKA